MRNGDILSFGAATVSIEKADLARGGQGTVHAAETLDRPPIRAIVKTMAPDPDQLARVEALIDRGLGERHPYLCTPLACALDAGELRVLSLMAEGKPLDQNDPRPLTILLETSHHAACLWTMLEEEGVDHGDVAPSNFLVSPRGSVSMIDFENWHANDGSAPPPTMIGQPMMLAPELVDGTSTPNRLSDQFAWAVLFNLLLLGRHPADGLAENPAERNAVMACGYWPEHDRTPDADELPIDALGPKLCALFDRGFSLLPAERPSADEWRRALHGGA